MSTLSRTLGNLRKVGIKDYFRQMLYIGDTKYGQLVGTDKYGNKYYENTEELPLRTRWVDYKDHDYDAAQIEPQWHLWMSQGVDTPPTQDSIMQSNRSWSKAHHIPNYTATRGAYKTYSTTKPKIAAWDPVAKQR